MTHVLAPRDVAAARAPGWEANRSQLIGEAIGKLRATASDLKATVRIPVHVHIAIGTPPVEIARRADVTGAGLVVVGSHGERPFRDMFLGATAQRLRRKLHVPLLVVRNRSAVEYERALIAVDFNAESAEAAVAVASLFPDAELHFLHVRNSVVDRHLSRASISADAIAAYRNQELDEAHRELEDFIRSNGLPSRQTSAVVKPGHVGSVVRQTADHLGMSVVAFGTKGKSRWESNLVGSVSEDFVGGGGHDVLLVNAARAWRADADDVGQHDDEAQTAEA